MENNNLWSQISKDVPKTNESSKISVVEAVRSAGAFFKPTNLLKKNDNISNTK